jgi:hypothetical protein
MRRTMVCCGYPLILLVLAGCKPDLGSTIKDIAKTSDALADSLQKVQDPPSAQSAIGAVDSQFKKLVDLFRDFLELMKRQNLKADFQEIQEMAQILPKMPARWNGWNVK